MTPKEFLMWLDGYLNGLGSQSIDQNVKATILGKVATVKSEPSLTETFNEKFKQMLHD